MSWKWEDAMKPIETIIVPIKQVPDTQAVQIDPETGTLIREGVPAIINPEDNHALEEAVRLKEQFQCRVLVLTMGPPQAEEALREALAMGADEAFHLCDRAFAGADTLATAHTLALGIRKIGKFDLIICGRQAIDGDTAQVGPQLAECLKIPQISFATRVRFEGDELLVDSKFGKTRRVVACRPPALITVLKEINEPRIPSVTAILDSYNNKPLTTWGNDALLGNPLRLGLSGSPTQVRKTFTPSHAREGKKYEGGQAELAEGLFQELKGRNFI